MLKKLALLFLLIGLLVGCATVGKYIGKPDFDVAGLTVDSLDRYGITFKCDYVVSNPYPVGIKIKQVDADINHSDITVVSLQTDEGLNLAAGSSNNNSVLFKIPYESIVELAGESRDSESLQFTIVGKAEFDLSGVPYLDSKNLSVPFSADFDVPVFTPEIKVSGGRIILPTVGEVAKSLVKAGMNIFKAGIAAGQLILGQPVEGLAFDSLELDVEIQFDLIVDNKGGAPFIFELNSCGIEYALGTLVSMEVLDGAGIIESSGESIRMSAVVNTLEFGALIAGLVGGEAMDTEIVIDSSLSFPGLKYNAELPLNVNQPIQPGTFKFGSK